MTSVSENNYFLDTLTADFLKERRTGKGVQVAVIDSGIDAEHPDLQGKIVESVEALIESSNKISFQPSTSGDSAGHGTACAGIIASIGWHSGLRW